MSAENKRVKLGILNIVTHPHATLGYSERFIKASKLKKIIQVWGDYHALIHSSRKISNGPEALITGEIYKFLDIKPTDEWYNLIAGEIADAADRRQITIPEHLKAKLKRIRYVFNPSIHRLIFTADLNYEQYGGMPTSQMKTFIEDLFNAPELLIDYPEVEVTVEQEPLELDRILNLKNIQMLAITLKKPNNDDPGGFAADMAEHLQELGGEKQTLIIEAPKKGRLTPSEKTKALGKMALSNGKVDVDYLDNHGIPQSVSTQNKPKLPGFMWDVNGRGFYEAFMEKALEIFNSLRKR